jgi:hypothetical protein
MATQIYIRVFNLAGLGADHIRRYPKGKVSITAELSKQKVSTSLCSFGNNSVKVDQVAFSANEGLLKWEISPAELHQMKAVQPKLKLHIMVHSATNLNDSVEAAYVLIDLRDLSKGEIKQQAYKTNKMPGGELTLSCRQNVAAHATRHPTRIIDEEVTSTSNNNKNVSVASSLAASTDSIRSVLRLALAGQPAPPATATSIRFSFSVGLHDFHSLNILCEKIIKNDQNQAKYSDYGEKQAAADAARNRTFWLCWTIFDKMFTSTEFQYGQLGPQRVKDTIKIECPLNSIQAVLNEASPLRVYLCTQGELLACSDIPLPSMTDNIELFNDDNIEIPPVISSEGWAIFNSNIPIANANAPVLPAEKLSELAPKLPTVAAVKLAIAVSFDSIIGGEDEGDDENEDEGETEYADEDFEDEKSAHVHFADNNNDDNDNAVPTLNAPEPSAVKPKEVGVGVSMYEEGQEGEGNSNGIHDDNDDETNLRHFRVSVDVRSIGSFKRPAQVSILYTYPHLGSSAPVRTAPVWVLANSEVRIDGGVASYECVMTRANLRSKLNSNHLRIQCQSKSNLGSTALGEAMVDLSCTHSTNPMHYRCPSTGKNFKTRSDYSRHRQNLLTLHAAGRLSTPAPSIDPIYVRCTDSFVNMTAPSDNNNNNNVTGKMRVVVITEDMGVVGSKQSVNVKPGYSQHGAGVYVSDDPQQQYVDPSDMDSLNNNSRVKNPLDSDNNDNNDNKLSLIERKKLEQLQMEWEGWRRHAENEWRENLQQKEQALRKRLESEAVSSLANRADDLRRAHEEAGRLEVRLRTAIDNAERQGNVIELKKEQMNLKLAQKTGELQLLQKRIKDEAKIRIDHEKNRSDSLSSQLGSCQIDLARMEKRAKESEKEYENYRYTTRSLPENVLREEVSKLKAQLSETRAEIERERRVRSEAELEKEHYRSQMHRLALALKREREKSNTIARQELEQLRLEFLAREERYVLDGDRDELRTIRHELSNLRSANVNANANVNVNAGIQHVPSSMTSVHASNATQYASKQTKEQISALLSTGLYSENDSIIAELNISGSGSGSGAE